MDQRAPEKKPERFVRNIALPVLDKHKIIYHRLKQEAKDLDATEDLRKLLIERLEWLASKYLDDPAA
jgi:hypothetical protein